MNCSRAQAAISERMDGEHLPARVVAALDQHLAGCATCRAFEAGAWKLREQVRFGVAPAVPDLVESIMTAVGTESRAPARSRPRLLPAPRTARIPHTLRPRRRFVTLAPAVAALLVGAVVGSLIVGGPFRRPEEQAAIAAAQITDGIARAASRLSDYEATFQITEHHFADDVAVRELSMSVWFAAPEQFRLDVTDHTAYPTRHFTPTDLQLVVNGSTWYSSGPAPCQFAQCPPKETVVTNRVPFSSTSPTPTDLVLPVTTLADADQLTVLGSGTVLGRRAIEVELPFERAAPLFPFLALGGSWRPFFPNDHVDLWLDARDWFPLRWTVYPAAGPERDQWALRFGLPHEPAKRPIFQVTALSLDERAPTPGTFFIPQVKSAQDAGARVVDLADAPKETGFEPVTPAETDHLDLYRVVLPASDPSEPPDETLITYSKGLSWLKLGETRSWTQQGLFGPVGFHAEEVPLADGGIAYYEPATDEHGRRLSIHSAGTDLYLETNLSREDLLRVAASLPVQGIAMPEAWRVRVSPEGVTERASLEQIAEGLPFPLQTPTQLPEGYAFASAELVTVAGGVSANLYYQQTDADLGLGPIRLHLEPGGELPPAASATQSAVTVRGAEGRWTPEQGRLEWVQHGVYVSLDATGLGLEQLLAVASSLAPYVPSTTPTPSPDASASPSPPPSPSPDVQAGVVGLPAGNPSAPGPYA